MGRRYLYRWPKDQVLFGLSSVELSSQLLCARSSVLCTTRRYGLLGLRPSTPYEVRISYPSTVSHAHSLTAIRNARLHFLVAGRRRVHAAWSCIAAGLGRVAAAGQNNHVLGEFAGPFSLFPALVQNPVRAELHLEVSDTPGGAESRIHRARRLLDAEKIMFRTDKQGYIRSHGSQVIFGPRPLIPRAAAIHPPCVNRLGWVERLVTGHLTRKRHPPLC